MRCARNLLRAAVTPLKPAVQTGPIGTPFAVFFLAAIFHTSRPSTFAKRSFAMIATISRQQLQRKLEHGGNLILVEALPTSDFEEGHLPNAVNLPPDRVRELAADVIPNKDAEI